MANNSLYNNYLAGPPPPPPPPPSNPTSTKPALRFATLPYSHSYVTLAHHHGEVLTYMRRHNKYGSAAEAIRALKEG